jgi:hypothetical protein
MLLIKTFMFNSRVLAGMARVERQVFDDNGWPSPQNLFPLPDHTCRTTAKNTGSWKRDKLASLDRLQ